MMPQKGRDRQSLDNLPESVIDVILMCLPLQDAVRTSILSKKWRYNWCRIPHLKLDEETLLGSTRGQESTATRFTNIVYHFLTFHTGPITKFTLSIRGLSTCPNFDNLIYFLSRNGIQDLVVRLSDCNQYKLPSSFFTCLQMKHLNLHNCLINPPPNFEGFHNLISLRLWKVTLTSKLLECLIPCSPLLEQLVLHSSTRLEHIKINAPKLRCFDFDGSIDGICLKNSPLLEKLSLVDTRSPAEIKKCDLVKLLESFPALKHLELDYYCLESLAAGKDEVPARLPFALNCLKHLSLFEICPGNFVETACALCLIRSSPYLQHIEFRFEDRYHATPSHHLPSLEIIQAEGSSDVTFNHLRSVKLTDYTGAKPEAELIKLLLAKSPMLVRMLIQPDLDDKTNEVMVLAGVTKFPRASRKAEVVYDTMY